MVQWYPQVQDDPGHSTALPPVEPQTSASRQPGTPSEDGRFTHANFTSLPGTGDVTGPIVETNMFGYASLPQTDNGLHMRQWARAFVIADAQTPSERILFITADIWSGDTAVRKGILTKLEELYPGVYSESNVALVGTHSHSGVGGYTGYLLPQITSMGFIRQSYDAVVQGSVRAATEAHELLSPGTLSLGNTSVNGAAVNRSPSSYLANPKEERDRYPGDVDSAMSLLKFTDASGEDRGFLSFFAVHGVSIYENNTLISSDNKGMAAHLYESYKEPSVLPGKHQFVAGFTQATSGDITGPGYQLSDFKSNEIIGTRQFDAARTLMEDTKLTPVEGPIRSLHSYVDMSNYTFILTNGTEVTTCSPALGYGFAGGTTDGPGAFSFIQGDNTTTHHNPFWDVVKGERTDSAVTAPPSQEEKDCHWPKPILLNVGRAEKPYQWSPTIVDIQIFRVGQLVMLLLPSEFTTMSGRRLREAVKIRLVKEGIIGDDAYVVASGPANTYSHYTTTPEEYAIQRYEGGSTLYGPHQLEAYIDLYTSMVPFLADNATTSPPPGPEPEDLLDKAISLQKGVVYDGTPMFKKFGDIVSDVENDIYRSGRTVSAVFQGANPRNNLRLEETFLAIQHVVGGTWQTVRTDAHPSTTFTWKRTNKMGAGLARSISSCSPSITLFTSLSGRSESSRARAAQAGLQDVPMEELIAKSSVVISVLPPSLAVKLAVEIKEIYDSMKGTVERKEPPIYVDANAVSPSTTSRIAKLLASSSIPFVDGSIIGGPPRDGYDPRLYISAEPKYEGAMSEIVELLGGGGKHRNGKGLDFHILKDGGVGAASALKASLSHRTRCQRLLESDRIAIQQQMSYAGITKGSTGLMATMILSATAHSPQTAQAFLEELAYSQADVLKRSLWMVDGMIPKAYRWVGEMEEIADYIFNPTGAAPESVEAPSRTEDTSRTRSAGDIADTYRGIARMFQRIADDVERKASHVDGDAGDAEIVKAWAEKGRKMMAKPPTAPIAFTGNEPTGAPQ
ncbi:hypothetical protein FRB96_001874 [Tulasnella sp. 330]|nr:hypothetical protein FRB96_001874 [Tulasnella sp. 330]